jgi:uncharacterized protein
MKILAISDIVMPQMENLDNLRRSYGDCEALISCGDLPSPYLDVIASTLNLPLFFVKGNHDTQYETGKPGGENLNGRVIRYKGWTIAGLEGSPRYNFEPLQYSEREMTAMALGLASSLVIRRLVSGYGADILVTHAPPRNIHDRPDRAHRGFRIYRLLLQLCRPRYMLHGHVDKWDNRRASETVFAGTRIININPVKLLTLERS